MAKKNNKGVKTTLRELAPGGITKKELKQVSKNTGASSQEIIKRMDAMNKAGQDVRLNSAAANMLIKEAQKTPLPPIGQQSYYGTGNIGRTLQGMIGTPGFAGQRNPQSGTPYGGSVVPATPGTGLMIGGTQIRPGGRVRTINNVGSIANDGTIGGDNTLDGGDNIFNDGSTFDGAFPSVLDQLSDMQLPEFDMSALMDMLDTGFNQLSSQFDIGKPLQLAQLGKSYTSDAIRAKRRSGRRRGQYRRGLGDSLSIMGTSPAQMSIGGGVTL